MDYNFVYITLMKLCDYLVELPTLCVCVCVCVQEALN